MTAPTREELAAFLVRCSDAGGLAGVSSPDDYDRARRDLRHAAAAILRPERGVSREAVLDAIRSRYDGMTREDWDEVLAAVRALPAEPEPSQELLNLRGQLAYMCGKSLGLGTVTPTDAVCFVRSLMEHAEPGTQARAAAQDARRAAAEDGL